MLPSPRRPKALMTSDAPLERITPEDLGLPEGVRVPFRFAPGATWSPVVVSFPHVGLAWPHDLRPKPQADFARNADYEVHSLYRGIEGLGVATLAAHFSRLVVDLNRAPDDVARQLVPDHPTPRPRSRPGVVTGPAPRDWDRPGRGVVWASALTANRGTTRILRPPMSLQAFESRIARFHRPYYRALELLLQRRRERFGYAVLLDAHSMPSTVGVDLVLGTLDGASCAEPIAAAAVEALGGAAPMTSGLAGPSNRTLLSVRRDDPYQGGRSFARLADRARACTRCNSKCRVVCTWMSGCIVSGDGRTISARWPTLGPPSRTHWPRPTDAADANSTSSSDASDGS